MEIWGFVAVVAGVLAVIFLAARLLGRTDRNQGSTHGGGYSSNSDSSSYS